MCLALCWALSPDSGEKWAFLFSLYKEGSWLGKGIRAARCPVEVQTFNTKVCFFFVFFFAVVWFCFIYYLLLFLL